MTEITLAEAKVFYDHTGQAREVLVSYELFTKLVALVEEKTRQEDQDYFWTEDWQARVRAAEDDIRAGRTREVTADTLQSALEWLNE